MAAEVVDRQKLTQTSPPKAVSGGSSGVVVKSLAEIKREKSSRIRQCPPADETQSKTSERSERNRRDSKIQLYTVPGKPIVSVGVLADSLNDLFLCYLGDFSNVNDKNYETIKLTLDLVQYVVLSFVVTVKDSMLTVGASKQKQSSSIEHTSEPSKVCYNYGF